MTDTTQARTANPAAESFAALFEASTTQSDQIQEGDIVSGSVLKVGKDTVVVDIGYKSEGVISISRVLRPNGGVNVKPGDTVDVLVESKENDDGLVQLSKEKADKLKVWDEISAACERDELIEGTITACA
jgi:small subunit ribosomal protein S1